MRDANALFRTGNSDTSIPCFYFSRLTFVPFCFSLRLQQQRHSISISRDCYRSFFSASTFFVDFLLPSIIRCSTFSSIAMYFVSIKAFHILQKVLTRRSHNNFYTKNVVKISRKVSQFWDEMAFGEFCQSK